MQIKIQNYFLSSSLVSVVFGMLFISSCQKETTTIDYINNIKTELRIPNWCDGTPMPIPPNFIEYLPYIENDTCCCFKLGFSPIYLLNYNWQIIGVDCDSTYATYNGACGEITGKLETYEVETCINTRATHITVTLFYPWLPNHAYCTMIPLPCK